MNRYLLPVLLFSTLTISALAQTHSALKIVALQCEHLDNPLGIDNSSPRLSWKISDSRKGTRQTAYEIAVSTDSTSLTNGKSDVWQTGKISSAQTLINCTGALKSFTKYFWRVTVWDQDQSETVSPVAHFETAFLQDASWKGNWISDDKDRDFRPAPLFRKEFDIKKKVRQARVYIAVGGLYELYLNGKKIGNDVLNPAYTRFDRRTLYVTHDVTQAVKTDHNAIGVLLGNGWYNHQPNAVWYFHLAPWRARPTFCLDLRITYEDGTHETITSGIDWKTAASAITYNNIYVGEHYDARLEQPGWATASFDDSQWRNAIPRSAPSSNIVSQAMQPIRAVEEIKAKSVKQINDTIFLFDLGRNIAGVTELTVEATEGTLFKLKHGERLAANGRVDMSNIDIFYKPSDSSAPFQTDIFITKGQGKETFKPRFNYKGFQFVEVTTSKPLKLTVENLKGYFEHSAVPVMGKVHCSNETMNKLWVATNNSYLSNLYGYPTDCPQREKNGWTGDAHIAIETGLFNFDGITIYEKWLADHRDEQQPNGVLPAIIPTGGWGYTWANGPDWTSTIAIIPWNVYCFYGDTKMLRDNYENIKRYVDHINEVYPSGLTTWGLGDWVPVASKAPLELTSSLYYFVDADILANTAKLFGKMDDHNHYRALAEKIKNAINAKYLDRATGMYGSGLQTELSAPLHWGVVPEEIKAKVAANLAARVKADNYHFDVGILGAKTVLNALSDNGYPEIAYKVAAQETYPSLGWWIVNGATTLYENWKIDSKNDISLNHIMFGDIGAWFYKALGGIKPVATTPGFKEILLQPYFPDELSSFSCEHESPHGKIVSRWERSRRDVKIDIVVPPNTTATFIPPKGYRIKEEKSSPGTITLSSGTHAFVLTR